MASGKFAIWGRDASNMLVFAVTMKQSSCVETSERRNGVDEAQLGGTDTGSSMSNGHATTLRRFS